jgi:hypothetical protein
MERLVTLPERDRLPQHHVHPVIVPRTNQQRTGNAGHQINDKDQGKDQECFSGRGKPDGGHVAGGR